MTHQSLVTIPTCPEHLPSTAPPGDQSTCSDRWHAGPSRLQALMQLSNETLDHRVQELSPQAHWIGWCFIRMTVVILTCKGPVESSGCGTPRETLSPSAATGSMTGAPGVPFACVASARIRAGRWNGRRISVPHIGRVPRERRRLVCRSIRASPGPVDL
jgi:hypothetical protein